MKKLTIFLMLLITSSLFSQIKVTDVEELPVIGEVRFLGKFYASLTPKNDFVLFKYQDQNYKLISEVKSFYFRKSDLDDMYSLFSPEKDVKKGDTKKVELENGDVLIFNYRKSMGKIYADVTHYSSNIDGRIGNLTRKMVDELFGKR